MKRRYRNMELSRITFLSYLARERIFLKTAKNTTAPVIIAIGGPTESGTPYDISPLKNLAPINTVEKMRILRPQPHS